MSQIECKVLSFKGDNKKVLMLEFLAEEVKLKTSNSEVLTQKALTEKVPSVKKVGY